jgi:hypothetical protein
VQQHDGSQEDEDVEEGGSWCGMGRWEDERVVDVGDGRREGELDEGG